MRTIEIRQQNDDRALRRQAMKIAARDDAADAAAYRRVQQANQAQIVAKLLHDLRNPVHALRIAVELFNRLVQSQADASAMLPRAARYAPGAESAMEALSRQTERLATYLSPPRRPALQPIAVNACLEEIALLSREAAQPLGAEVRSRLSGELAALADRSRLSHGLLAWTRQNSGGALEAYEDDEGVWIAAGAVAPDADVRTLLEAAGGRLADTRVVFKRA
jgi:signal transduction histidine kinase